MKLVVAGAVGGLAWAGGLRAFMAEVAGPDSSYTWLGTMGSIVLPAVVVGSLLGWSEELRRDGGRRRNWLALSPLLLLLVTLAEPGAIPTLFSTGLGGGAIAVPLIGLAGAYAVNKQGRGWIRVACGAIALSIIPLWALGSASFGGNDMAVTTPHGAMVALHFYALLAVLAMAAALPLQPTEARGGRGRPKTAQMHPAGPKAAGE